MGSLGRWFDEVGVGYGIRRWRLIGRFRSAFQPALGLGLAFLLFGEFLLALLESVIGLRHLAPSKEDNFPER
jgi:hypothetical protein